MSPRRAALLGLNAPVSAVMLAVLGLWPEDEEPPLPDYRPPAGGVRGVRPRLRSPRPAFIWQSGLPTERIEPFEDEEALIVAGAIA